MDTVLQGVPQVVCYIDDILVTGGTEGEHLSNLEEVLKHLKCHNVRIHKEKCVFLHQVLIFWSIVLINRDCTHFQVRWMPLLMFQFPKSVTELKAFLGLVNYYAKLIPNFSTHLAPLYQLLKKGRERVWNEACVKAFSEAKQLLGSTDVLVQSALLCSRVGLNLISYM